MTKICKSCGEEKPLNEFYTQGKYDTGKQKYTARCRVCIQEARRQRLRVDSDAKRKKYQQIKDWQSRNREKVIGYKKEERRRQGILPKKEWPVAPPGFFVCRRCEIEKPTSDFPKTQHYRRGHGPYCNECKNKDNEKYHQRKNKPAPPTSDDEHYCRQCDAIKHNSEFYAKWKPGTPCRECLGKLGRKYRKANPDKTKHARKIREYRLRGASGSHTEQEWQDLKRRHSSSCLRCGRQEPEITLTRDHVIPIVNGGSNYISNIQPLCFSCNSSKGARMIDYRVSTAA